jgi:group I intron endonuclease
MKSGIYFIQNNATGAFYVGSSTSDTRARWRSHRFHLRRGTHVNRKLQNAWNKYGEINFSFHAVTGVAPEDCRNLEQVFINVLTPYYNLAGFVDSPMCGAKHTDAAKAKMRAAAHARYEAQELRDRIGEASKGRRHTTESRERISRTLSGRPRSEETKRKISEGHKRRLAQGKPSVA